MSGFTLPGSAEEESGTRLAISRHQLQLLVEKIYTSVVITAVSKLKIFRNSVKTLSNDTVSF